MEPVSEEELNKVIAGWIVWAETAQYYQWAEALRQMHAELIEQRIENKQLRAELKEARAGR